jgi:hypothetical protein
MSTGAWHHIAMTRTAVDTTFKLWLNGNLDATSVQPSGPANDASPLNIGQMNNVTADGWIDDVRITKGVARYTTNFVPPDQQFPDS